MVLWQLCTLDHLDSSGFGRPFPRHGLQLLFWFSNHCVTFELGNSDNIMKMAPECHPENGAYGFHKFGNMEELLPVLYKPKKRKNLRQLVYLVVGNLSLLSYPESSDLPAFVREHDGEDGSSNSDRIIIISYQAKTRKVERVYVTEHDEADRGGFRSDGTYEVCAELIRVLQNPQLDLSSFLTQMGYYDDAETLDEPEETLDPSAWMMLSMMRSDATGFFSDAFSQHLDPDRFCSSSQSVVHYSLVQKKKKKKKKKSSNKKPKLLREVSWQPSWVDPYRDYDYWTPSRTGSCSVGGFRGDYSRGIGGGGGGGGGFFRFLKVLLKVGAIYLAAKSFCWLLKNLQNTNWDQKILDVIPGRTSRYPSLPKTHIILDYVY